MPRKTNGMEYELLPRPTKGADGKPLLYARPSGGIRYDIDGIEDFCRKHRGMNKGDMSRFFTVFLDVVSIMMSDGSRIETPIGTFAPKLKLSGDFTDPTQVKREDVSLATIEFNPSKRFVQELAQHLRTGFREKENIYGRKPMHELRESGKIEEVLQELLNRNSFGIDLFVSRTGMKYNTARTYLNKLCKGENPLLTRDRYGNKNTYKAAKK